MMDVIVGALGSLKSASDITKGLLGLKIDAEVTAKAIELQGVIADAFAKLITAQTDQATALRRIDQLEAEIRRLKDWAAEKERYELHELTPGGFTYRVKPAMQGSEPAHDLCPNCYQDNIKSILQYSGAAKWHKTYTCQRCKTVVMGEGVQIPAASIPMGR